MNHQPAVLHVRHDPELEQEVLAYLQTAPAYGDDMSDHLEVGGYALAQTLGSMRLRGLITVGRDQLYRLVK